MTKRPKRGIVTLHKMIVRPKRGIVTLRKMIARPKHGIATLRKMIAHPKPTKALPKPTRSSTQTDLTLGPSPMGRGEHAS